MLKSYVYRLYPTPAQVDLLNQHIGATRFIYNLGLEIKQQAYVQYGKKLSCFDLNNQLPELKKECEWLKNIGSNSLQMAIRNLDNAYIKFFKGITKYPKFKKKCGKGAFQIPIGVRVKFDTGTIVLPKFREGIRAVIDRKFDGKIKTVTIRRMSTGKFFASILVDNDKEHPSKGPVSPNKVVGIDLGIKDFLVTSEGQKISNPRFLKKNLERLKILQKRASKKQKGSVNRKKANLKVALMHERIANSRKDFLHKLSTNLVKNHDGIAIEDLAVQNMLKNHKLAQAISDVSWGEFTRQLSYKCEWYGKHLLTIGRFEPSSKLCSNCGYTNHTLTLADRKWNCPSCSSHHDRDHNAAINIKKMAVLKYLGAGSSGEPVETLTLVGSMKQESTLKKSMPWPRLESSYLL